MRLFRPNESKITFTSQKYAPYSVVHRDGRQITEYIETIMIINCLVLGFMPFMGV